MKLFNMHNPIFNFLTRVWDVMILNLLWVVCSVPIITIGASTTALYYSLLRIKRETDSSITGMFFHSFRQNIKQASVMTILFAFSGLFLYVDIEACKLLNGTLSNIIMVILFVLLMVWGMMLAYAFPILAQFDNTVIGTMKNAFHMSVGNIGKSIIICFLDAIPIILFMGMPYVFLICIPVLLTVGVAVIARINTGIFVRIFDKYI